MKTIKVLLLEDDLETLSKLLDRLYVLEEKLLKSENKLDIGVTVLSTYQEVEEFINKTPHITYDIVLLDRDTKDAGSYYVLNLSKYDLNHVIGISSTPPYNEALRALGVTRVVQKDYQLLDSFADQVIQQIEEILLTLKA